MRVAYFDCFSGISGNMLLGAFLDAGMPLEYLETELKKLSVSGYKLEAKKVNKQGISAWHVDVISTKWFQPSRNLKDILKIINASLFSTSIKQGASMIFTRLGEAEAKVHGVGIEKVHFHEVGAVDAIVDIVGAMIGIEYFGIEAVYVSNLHVGSGFVKCSHGKMPVPAPATAELLKGIPFYGGDVKAELVTPTGAAIASTLGKKFGAIPSGFNIEKVAYGAGTMNLDIANVLRVYLGTIDNPVTAVKTLEINFNDINPQNYAYIMDKISALGVNEVYLTNILMPNGVLGTKLTIMVNSELIAETVKIIATETSATRIIMKNVDIVEIQHEEFIINSKWGRVRIMKNNSGCNYPFPEDCERIAVENQIPLKEVYAHITELAEMNSGEGDFNEHGSD